LEGGEGVGPLFWENRLTRNRKKEVLKKLSTRKREKRRKSLEKSVGELPRKGGGRKKNISSFKTTKRKT